VQFYAENFILLKEGFTVESNVDFLAFIARCN